MRIRFPEGEIEISPLSQKDYTGVTSVDIPNGAVVYGACFSQETPDTVVFRASMRDVTFRNCNLMNVRIPQPNNNVMIDCRVDQFKVQNDMNDWIVNDLGVPVEIMNKIQFTKLGLPLPLPSAIPAEKAKKRIDLLEIAKAAV